MSEFFNYISVNSYRIVSLLWQHIYLTVLAVAIAAVIGIPLGILISRTKRLAKPIIGFANIVQAIPSLAMLGFLIPFLGIGSRPAIVMVVLYSLLPIVKNTFTGLTNIDRDIMEAARGIGLTNGQIMRKIQLPLAMPVIMAGVRIAAVTAVGLMTIAAFIGAGGLGFLVYSGVATVDNNMILAGAIPACILALLIDYLVGIVEKKLSYTNKKNLDMSLAGSRKRNRQRKIWLAIAGVFAVLIIGYGIYQSIGDKEDTISIGSKNFTEQLIIGNMVAELIEANTDLKVRRDLNLGGTQVAFEALKAGEIDMYVDYTGTLLIDVLNHEVITDPDEVYQVVHDQLLEKFNIKTLANLGFNNTYTLAVRPDTAEQYGLETFSDLAEVSHELRLGATIEFMNREDGLPGLMKKYQMEFAGTEAVDGGLRYTALKNDEVQVINAFATDGLLAEFDLVVLKDDQFFFPPYYAVPIIRGEVIEEHPEIGALMEELASVLSDEVMRELNYRADGLNQAPEKVARDFLLEVGLIDR